MSLASSEYQSSSVRRFSTTTGSSDACGNCARINSGREINDGFDRLDEALHSSQIS